MNKLILKATEVNSTTIIPNFGAIMKMGKTFMYNEFLKYDDGKLTQFIADTKGIDVDAAKDEISNWVSSLQNELDEGKTVTFDGVGELTKVDGKIKFTVKTTTEETPAASIETVVPEKKVPEQSLKEPEEKQEKKEKKAEKSVTPEEEVKVEKEKKKTKISGDFKAKEAVEKIEKFTDKSDLIEFTRGEDRKTVIAALNTKLDELNGKKKEKKLETPSSAEIKPPKNVITEVKVEETKEKKKEESPVISPPKVEEKKPIEQTKEKELKESLPPVQDEKPQVKEEKTLKEKAAAIEKPKNNKEEEDAAIAAIVGGVEKTEKQSRKRKKRWILWVGLLLILIGGGTVGYLKKDMIMGWFDKTHEPKDLAEGHEEDDKENGSTPEEGHPSESETDNTTAEHDENNVEENTTESSHEVEETIPLEEKVETPVVEKPVKETPVVNNSSEGNWHIIAGSYSSKENAENKVKTLQSEGYSTAKVLGKYNGLYTVRVASYATKDEAKSALSNFTNSGNKGFIKNL